MEFAGHSVFCGLPRFFCSVYRKAVRSWERLTLTKNEELSRHSDIRLLWVVTIHLHSGR
jgi:hypothetical protein